jgi:predicted anti-sigma-YlaC factor YlaD
MPTCQELNAFVIDYLEGTLPVFQRLVSQPHLGMCPKCRACLQGYRRTVRLSHDAYAQEGAREAIPPELIDAILAARKGGI